jgi:hypothetical protein
MLYVPEPSCQGTQHFATNMETCASNLLSATKHDQYANVGVAPWHVFDWAPLLTMQRLQKGESRMCLSRPSILKELRGIW